MRETRELCGNANENHTKHHKFHTPLCILSRTKHNLMKKTIEFGSFEHWTSHYIIGTHNQFQIKQSLKKEISSILRGCGWAVRRLAVCVCLHVSWVCACFLVLQREIKCMHFGWKQCANSEYYVRPMWQSAPHSAFDLMLSSVWLVQFSHVLVFFFLDFMQFARFNFLFHQDNLPYQKYGRARSYLNAIQSGGFNTVEQWMWASVCVCMRSFVIHSKYVKPYYVDIHGVEKKLNFIMPFCLSHENGNFGWYLLDLVERAFAFVIVWVWVCVFACVHCV